MITLQERIEELELKINILENKGQFMTPLLEKMNEIGLSNENILHVLVELQKEVTNMQSFLILFKEKINEIIDVVQKK